MRVKEILKEKGSVVHCIEEGRTVQEAVKLLVDQNIGALLVAGERSQIVGIISERDILRRCAANLDGLAGVRVAEVMTRALITGEPEDDLDRIQELMTKHRIRHMPIFEGGRLAGIVSIGDVLKVVHSQTEVENRELKEFISAQYLG